MRIQEFPQHHGCLAVENARPGPVRLEDEQGIDGNKDSRGRKGSKAGHQSRRAGKNTKSQAHNLQSGRDASAGSHWGGDYEPRPWDHAGDGELASWFPERPQALLVPKAGGLSRMTSAPAQKLARQSLGAKPGCERSKLYTKQGVHSGSESPTSFVKDTKAEPVANSRDYPGSSLDRTHSPDVLSLKDRARRLFEAFGA
ncbi:unnamed protein product [Ostreobium quekettii]|uniref:Uncharacterized protein n=1 Tax=Ostreobium quekettii TaxID=121088 RepID=A0A8S1ILI8_9CHLO|nr:unnamed protein product [Ostreobium quekettii]